MLIKWVWIKSIIGLLHEIYVHSIIKSEVDKEINKKLEGGGGGRRQIQKEYKTKNI